MDVDDMLRRVRSGLDESDFTLLFLWIRFWANGGGACIADLVAVLHGRKVLSEHDTLVLGTVMAELTLTEPMSTISDVATPKTRLPYSF